MGAQGICFAVAANTANFVLGELVRHGRMRRCYIGISAPQTALPRRLQVAAGLTWGTAAIVTAIEKYSPARHTDLMAGDIIVGLDGTSVTGVDDLTRLLTGDKIGQPVAIDLIHLGKRRSVAVVPEERRRG
jgi:S1-C subfamily serine protease